MSTDNMQISGPGPTSNTSPSAGPPPSDEEVAASSKKLSDGLGKSHPGADDADNSDYADNTAQN